MAQPSLVPSLPEINRGQPHYTRTRPSYANLQFQNNVTPAGQTPHTNGRDFIRTVLINNNVPVAAVDLVLASLAPSTIKQYTTELKKWHQYCDTLGISSLDVSRPSVLDFLTSLFEAGASYGTINLVCSALSIISGNDHIGDNPMVCRLIKGVFRLKPPRPKYNYTWDVNIVLDHLQSKCPNSTLSLRELSLKLVTLLAFGTGHRMKTLASIKLNNIRHNRNGIMINITDIIKTS